MAKVMVFTNLTLDGVMQAPGGIDEDTRDGFQYGGWAAPYAAMTMTGHDPSEARPLLFGRKTYEIFYSYWPHQTNNPFTDILNRSQKYVASNTLKEPLPWVNSTLLSGNVPEAVAKLKAQPGKDMMIMGSGVLTQSLMRHNLIDLYVLLVHPLVLGTGRRLFPEGGVYANFQLVDSKITPNGVAILTYQPAESALGTAPASVTKAAA